ncbi:MULTISPECIES: invasion associated locus B family protein [Thioclava]|uniref:invasion associated locus B family protein n=1 Tax=Thioclava TaxID=285107 RepID=UPI000C47F1B1|nr:MULTISPECIES: invasion associated locus B family protein [Thioclava]MAQ37577.1 invasion-associated locus B family protein [Thioclava sp.]
MSQLTKPLALALALGLASGAWAQDTTSSDTTTTPSADATAGATTDGAATPAADAGADATSTDQAPDATANGADATPTMPGADQQAQKPQEPQTYTKATYGDWELQCAKSPDGKDPCQMYQVIKDQNGGNVADISVIGLPDGSQAAAGLTIMVPMQTLLSQNLVMQVDGGKAMVYPYSFCDPRMMGCFARFGVGKAELESLKKGSKATITITPLANPQQKVKADISLSGFTKAFDETVKTNKENGVQQ